MPTDPLRAELLRLREIVCDEDAEAIDRALAAADARDEHFAPLPEAVKAQVRQLARLAVDQVVADPPPGHHGAAGAFARLDSFRDLEPGWDSYGAQPIDPRAIAAAQALLHSLTVAPTARGGVLIEAGEVEVEFAPDGRMVEDAPGRPWTRCADGLPEAPGRYEVAAIDRMLGETRRGVYVGRWTDAWQVFVQSVEIVATVYAWRPIAEDPPPLRPADREYLAAQGVPAETVQLEEVPR